MFDFVAFTSHKVDSVRNGNPEATMLAGNDEYHEFMDQAMLTNLPNYIDLPMTAVMGDTSSGKSSLLSAISMVELPISHKLTTRCPIMMKMSYADNLSGTVSISWKGKLEGRSDQEMYFKERKVNDSSWHKLTDFIAEAMNHIIDMTGKEVARDLVVVDVAGPHCENITLIDLPGIVRSTGAGESDSLPEDVQGLIDEYLKNPRCIILAVHPACVDFHNSQMMAEAKKVDPQNKRTLVVITKPDSIDPGAEEGVKELLLGSKTGCFEEGFHMVKGRGQRDLNQKMTIEESLEKEAEFFDVKWPWCDVDDRSLFGTEALRRKLGDRQMKICRESFPAIIEQIKQDKAQAEERLDVIGRLPEDMCGKRILFAEIKQRIVRDIRMKTQGQNRLGEACAESQEQIFTSKFNETCEELKSRLSSSRLANISSIREKDDIIVKNQGKDAYGTVVKVLDDEVFMTGRSKKDATFFSEKIVGRTEKRKGEVWLGPDGKVYLAGIAGAFASLKPFPKNKVRRDPGWIEELIRLKVTNKLEVFANSEVFEQIFVQFLKEWQEACAEFVEKAFGLVRQAVTEVIDNDYGIVALSKLRDLLRSRSRRVIDDFLEAARREVRGLFGREKEPFTQNDSLGSTIATFRLNEAKEEILDALRGLHLKGAPEQNKSLVLEAVARVFDQHQTRSIRQLMAQDMENVLDVYSKIAFERVQDGVPMICRRAIASIPDELNRILELLDAELEKVLVFPNNIMKERDGLLVKRDALNDGLKLLNDRF